MDIFALDWNLQSSLTTRLFIGIAGDPWVSLEGRPSDGIQTCPELVKSSVSSPQNGRQNS